MKVYDRDLRKIKTEIDLNNEIRFRGMKKPPAKIRVKAIKLDNGVVKVELVDIPAHIKFKRLRQEKKKAEIDKKEKASSASKDAEAGKNAKDDKKLKPEKIEKDKEKSEESEEDKDREQASREESLKLAKEQAKEQKHVSKIKDVKIQRKALSR